MAELTQEELATGFQCVLDRRWQDFGIWMAARDMPTDQDGVMRWMKMCMRTGDTGKAEKMFAAVFVGMNPERTKANRKLLRRGCLAVLLVTALGIAGGIFALVKAVFW